MTVLCPTCHGRKTIDDPTIRGSMAYYDAQGNTWPQVCCQTCFGTGWVEEQADKTERTNYRLLDGSLYQIK